MLAALVGLAFPFWRRRTVLAMVMLCALYLATLLLFYIRSRYRIPALPFLLLFASVAVERGLGWGRVGYCAPNLAAIARRLPSLVTLEDIVEEVFTRTLAEQRAAAAKGK